MKKLLFTLLTLLAFAYQAKAMSFEQARQQALFLTDKMAYELNLTDDQYEAAYEINLDYLLSIDHDDDLYGIYWRRRNQDLSYILYDWQYRAYYQANYFYRLGKAVLQLEKKRTAEAGFHAFYIRKINNSLLRNLHESTPKQADHFIKPFPGIIFSRFSMDNRVPFLYPDHVNFFRLDDDQPFIQLPDQQRIVLP